MKVLAIDIQESHLPYLSEVSNMDYYFIGVPKSDWDSFLDSELSSVFKGHSADLIILPYSLSSNYIDFSGLRAAAHIRFTEEWGNTRTPIVFWGNEDPRVVAKMDALGSILFSKGIYTTDCTDLLQWIREREQYLTKLTDSEYAGIFDRVFIKPQSNLGSNHSVANIWGASVLNTAIGSNKQIAFSDEKLRASLFFKYSKCLAHSELVNPEDSVGGKNDNKYLVIKDEFPYLLIDDEAAKGWSEVLKNLMPNAQQDVSAKTIHTFDDLDAAIQENIKNGKYDLIFLDLRLAGTEEDKENLAESFSGMKVLRSIKEINPGIQVIMLTATNKSWNLKALLDAGANGYYMKEAPEYRFSQDYSYHNAESFVNTIDRCLDDAYLEDIYFHKEEALEELDKDGLTNLRGAIHDSWESAFVFLNLHDYKTALLQLIKAIEAYANIYTDEKKTYGSLMSAHVMMKTQGGKEVIYDNGVSYYKAETGVFGKFQSGDNLYTQNISAVREGIKEKPFGKELPLPLKIAAVMDHHLNNLKGIKRICELNFIRNKILAHHGAKNEYIEKNRPVTKADCEFLFYLTYDLIMAN